MLPLLLLFLRLLLLFSSCGELIITQFSVLRLIACYNKKLSDCRDSAPRPLWTTHILPELHSLRYIFNADSMGLTSVNLTQLLPKDGQSHRFLYRSKARMQLPSSKQYNLISYLAPFWVAYWSSHHEASLFNSVILDTGQFLDWRSGLQHSIVSKTAVTCEIFQHFITVRLHVMQRTVLLSEFCPSVCLSVRQMRVLWQN